MKVKANILGQCAFAAMAFALTTPASAQEAGTTQAQSDETFYEGDIIVTARRRVETAQETPVAMTVLNEALLDRYGVKGVATIAQMTPGLVTGESSGSVGGSISLRGVGSGESQPFIDQVVSLNVDGVQISTAQLLRAAQLDLKQIEVLRGPQALFFGKNSPGGVISLISADPGDRLEVMARAGYEFKADERYAEATVSAPLTDTLGVRLAGRYSRMNGYIKIISPNPPAGIDPYDLSRFPDQKEGFLRGTVAFKPSDRLSVKIKGTYTNTRIVGGPSFFSDVTYCPYGTPQESPISNDCKNDGTIVASLIPAAYLPLNDINLNDRHGGRKNEQLLLTGNIEYKLNDNLTLTSVTGYYDVNEHLMSSGTYNVSQTYAYAVRFSTSQFSEELRLASSFDGPLNFLAGGYYETRKLYTATHLGVPAFLMNLNGIESTHQKQDSYSAFGQLLWDVAPKVQITAGGRYTHEIKNLLDYTLTYPNSAPVDVTLQPTYPGNPNPKAKFNNFSPELTVTYKPVTDVMLFASFKRGFKSGGFDAGYTAGTILLPSRQAETQIFKPEKVQGFEGGLKSTLFDRQLTFNVTGYWYDYKDLQVATFDTSVHAFTTSNAAKARVRGIEIETSYRPKAIPGFNIHASAAFNDAKFRKYLASCWKGQTRAMGCDQVLDDSGTAASLAYNPATGLMEPRYTSQDLSGHRLRKSAPFTANIGAYYETPVASSLMASLSTDLAYSDGYTYGDGYQPFAYQKAFAKLDATLRLFTEDKKWELALIGRNLTNKRNLINGNDRSGTGGGKGGFVSCATKTSTNCDLLPDITATPTQPRTVTVQATFRY